MKQLLLVLICGFTIFFSSTAQSQQVIHHVAFQETINSICQQYYGTINYAPLLRQLNGLKETDALKPGQRIFLPTSFSYSPTQDTTIEEIALNQLGDRKRARILALLNKLGNQRQISAGHRLLIPYVWRRPAEPKDSWSTLAATHLNSARHAVLLAEFNGYSLKKIMPGTIIRIPLGYLVFTQRRWEDLINERLLGIGDNRSEYIREALQETNALVRRGEYFAVPLRLLSLLVGDQKAGASVAELFKLLAITYVAIDQPNMAIKAFREALLRQSNLTLDPVTTSPKVIKAFVDAKAGLLTGEK